MGCVFGWKEQRNKEKSPVRRLNCESEEISNVRSTPQRLQLVRTTDGVTPRANAVRPALAGAELDEGREDRLVPCIRCARLTGERQGVRVPRNEGVTNHVSPRAVRRSSRGVRRSVGSGSCGRAVEHRKGTCPGCRGFRIGRRQHRWPRYGERSASPAVSENPCTHESLSSGPGRPPPHLGLSAGVAKGRQNCRSRRRTGRRSQTRS